MGRAGIGIIAQCIPAGGRGPGRRSATCAIGRRLCDTQGMRIDPLLLEILVCPVSKAPLKEIEGALVSTDPETRMRYRIDGSVPVMMAEEAEKMSEEAWKAVMSRG